MARAHLRAVLTDVYGTIVANQQINIYQPGTTTPPIGTMYNASSGGSAVVNPRTANVLGEVELWLEYPQEVDITWTDRTGAHTVRGRTDDMAQLNTAVQYVHPSGNDSNDGLSWATPKKYILSAYDALPTAGGTIYIADQSNVGGEVANQGIWIIGPFDPDFASPPAGWRQQKIVEFIGRGSATRDIHLLGQPAARILGGTTDFLYDNIPASKPVFAIAGTLGCSLSFRNLQTNGFVGAGIVAGISADGTNRDMNTSLVTFENVSIATYNAGQYKVTPKPVVDCGYLFWGWFKKCSFGAYAPPVVVQPTDTDDHAAWLFKPEAGTGSMSGVVFIEDCISSGGGIRYYNNGGSLWGPLVVKNYVMEGASGVDPAPSAVKFIGSSTAGTAILESITGADIPSGSDPVIDIDDGMDPNQVLVMGVTLGGPVDGPATVVGAGDPFDHTLLAGKSMAGLRQAGFGPRGKIVGNSDAGRRLGAPTAARWVNKANSDSGAWGAAAGTATVTTGLADPHGKSNAATLSTATSGDYRRLGASGVTVAVGDWIIAGAFVRGNGTAPLQTTQELLVVTNPAVTFARSGNGNIGIGLAHGGDGEWQFLVDAQKITADAGVIDLLLDMNCATTKSRAFYMPMLLHVPASGGTHSDSEVVEFMNSIGVWSSNVIAGDVGLLPGQALSLDGTRVLKGIGSPEGVYTAPPGSVFLRTDGGASTTSYKKTTGSGNTGWLPDLQANPPSAYTVTNGVSDRAYDANATTTDELADVLGTLIADLKTYGILQ